MGTKLACKNPIGHTSSMRLFHANLSSVKRLATSYSNTMSNRKKLNRGINLEVLNAVLNMPCFLLAWNYLSQANKLPSLLYQRRGADSKIDSKFSRSSHRRCSVKKGVLKISQISQENTCVRVSF